MRRLAWLVLVVVGSFGVMVSATLLAQASSNRLAVAWMSPKEVSQSGALDSKAPDMAVDGTGHVHIVWAEGTLGQEDIRYIKSSDHGNAWTDPETVDTTLGSHDASVAVDITGTVHACWWDGNPPYAPYKLLYAQRTSGGWTMDEPGVVVTDSWITQPAIRVAGDEVHVVWSNWLEDAADIYYSRRPIDGGEWLTPTVIVDTGPASQCAGMAVDQHGDLHLAWHENLSPTNEIMYVSGTVGIGETTWSSPVTVSLALSADATTPDIFVGDDDEVHIVFSVDVDAQQNTQDVYYARFPLSNTENISPTLIPGSRVVVSGQWPTYASPAIEGDEQGRVHVLWNGKMGTDSSDRVYHALSGDGGAHWSAPWAVSPHDGWPDGLPTMATDGTLVHAAWQQKTIGDDQNDDDIYYSHSLRVSGLLPLALKDYS